MLLWPAVSALGFLLLVGLVVGLGLSSTARYAGERNRVQAQPRPAPVSDDAGATATIASTAASTLAGRTRRGGSMPSSVRAPGCSKPPPAACSADAHAAPVVPVIG